ncbi:hypothetical protein DSO57_1033153 [Entomophthora muscae]|uniref:Uncharacterized protein n=1 Tax=Entomophthora muscae TaxID=34485 RepID=A0ACC2T031_9FUNG|nr:hypothetical protein DSO57_1033153 [Entomophthora muscae]
MHRLGRLRRRSTGARDSFLKGVCGSDGKLVSNYWRTEIAVLHVINTTCPRCLKEAKVLGDTLKTEFIDIQLVAIVQDAPQLGSYLSGGLKDWHLIVDLNGEISRLINLHYPSLHSTFIIAPGGIMLASFEGNNTKSLASLSSTLDMVTNHPLLV